jgi:sugar lactone lactonase YvrE
MVILMLAVLILPSLAAAQAQVAWVKEYNPALGELPEGIAVDRQGNIYVSFAPLGQVRKISPDGTESLLYQFPEGTM